MAERKADEHFDEKCADICKTYKKAPERARKGVRTVSIDEMTGIQALERAAPSKPMQPGKVELREYEYKRHGTKTLIAVSMWPLARWSRPKGSGLQLS